MLHYSFIWYSVVKIVWKHSRGIIHSSNISVNKSGGQSLALPGFHSKLVGGLKDVANKDEDKWFLLGTH